jgi:F-type H+-transporting ATPase subunit c
MDISPEVARFIAIGFAAGIGVIAPAIAIGQIGRAAMEALGRNPEARGAIMTNMILSIAFAEAVAIYVLVVCILLIFVGVR